ncbi:hypothetical protein D3C80_1530750 [compost metagenome]
MGDDGPDAIAFLHAGMDKRLHHTGHFVVKLSAANLTPCAIVAMGDDGQPFICIAQQVFGIIEPRARIELGLPYGLAGLECRIAARTDNAEFVPQHIVKFIRRVDGPAQQAGIIIGGHPVQLCRFRRESEKRRTLQPLLRWHP